MPIRSILPRFGLAVVLSLAACGGDSTGSGSTDGRILFSYSGAESGRFVAKGYAENGTDPEYAYASLFRSSINSPALLVIRGSMRLDNGYDARLTIVAPSVVARTGCVPGLYGCDTSAEFVLKARSGSTNEDRIYLSRSIEVDVTEVAEQRARGTFTITLEQVAQTGAFNGRAVEVHSGEFDVPVVDLPAGSASASWRGGTQVEP